MTNWNTNYTYFITYSCYTRKMTVLLNGKETLSRNSAILQYMNEPFYRWCSALPELLYRELGEDYRVVYTGRQEEAEILRTIFSRYPHCLALETRDFELQKPLQERMIALSRLMKEKNLPRLPQRIISAVFAGSKKNLEKWKPLLQELDVKNQYCSVAIHTAEWAELSGTDRDVVVFALCATEEEQEEVLERLNGRGYAFLLTETGSAGFQSVTGHSFIYGITEKDFFPVIFDCLLLFPLAECFAQYASDLRRSVREAQTGRKLEALLAVKPCIYVKAPERIEVGTSEPFTIETEPEGVKLPGLTFEYQLPGIVTCNEQRIFGEKAGKTKVRVFEKGSAEPLCELSFEVYTRNRIRELLLSDYSKAIGVGDILRLTCSWQPEDADNADSLQWYSDQEKVAIVTASGNVKALSLGRCRIYCAAEKVSAFCSVEVKPYLTGFSLPFDKGEPVHLAVGETRQIRCRVEPEGAIDGRLIFSSTDLMTVNAGDGQITGVADGEADIIVENASKRFREQFHVVVGRGNPPPEPPKKKFFGLFG